MFAFRVRQIGCNVATVLEFGGNGHVMAVFDHSYYVDIDGVLLCIGNANMGAAPLNLPTSAPASTNWPASGVRANDRVHIRSGDIRVGTRFSFSTADAPIWRPAAPERNWNAASLEAGLNAFRQAAELRIPTEGLGRFIRVQPDTSGALADSAAAPIGELHRWLAATVETPDEALSMDATSLYRLTGLGPGLTPSGDDFIGGVLIALHAFGFSHLARQLWRRVEPHLAEAGNPISSAHVGAAAQGFGAESVHQVLAAIQGGRRVDMETAITAVDKIGHTSGWDTVAGIVQVVDVLWRAGPDG